VAINPSAELSGRRADGFWGLDHMDRGIYESAQRNPDSRRGVVHATFGASGHHIHPLRAWIILGIVSPTGVAATAAFATIFARGH